MKSLRRSLNNKEPPSISTPISTYPGPPRAVSYGQQTKKHIRCITPYRAQRPQELSCAVGDVLYVIRDIEMGWYEAMNPSTNGRGVVPKTCFEVIPGSGTPSIQAGPNARLPSGVPNRASAADPTLRKPAVKHQTFYAIVQYDFQAERPDELDAKAGEPISVVAQSNREWFVAKPIGRLGGPGLIPVSFVEIRDPVTNQAVRDVGALMDKGVLPRVEEWKQATAEYKASSIPLGVLDESTEVVKDSPFMRQAPGQQQQPPHPNYSQPPQQYNQQPPQHQRNQSQAQSFATNHSRALSRSEPEPEGEPQNASDFNQEMLPPGKILSATIPSFHFENNEYWFRLDVIYQTLESPSRTLQLVLYRNYDDFYDFQISLLDAFPVEAGRVPDKQASQTQGYPTPPSSVEETSTRILPYMPGPVSFVDDMITSVRRTELDQYLDELLQLEGQGNGYILKHNLFRSFLYPKSGDIMEEGAPAPVERASVARNSEFASEGYGQQAEADYVAEDMNRMHIGGPSNSSDGRPNNDAYDPYQSNGPSRSGYSPQGGNDYDDPSNGGRYSGTDYGVGRSTPGKLGSASPPKNQYARSRVDADDSRPGSYADNIMIASATSSYYDPQSASSSHIRQQSYSQNTTLSPPLNQTPGGNAGGSRSARSSAGPNDMAASPNASEVGSSGGAPPAFLKIKIFHSQSDDLIAIRVPPRVTYTQLIAKVRDRLGGEISVLRYRESYDGNKVWGDVKGDTDLREWLSKGDKLVLYAD
ncbi:bud emergence protein 1 [Tulasnella sp. UAMH 9824]|nr:bud emergence protein 1 [Tulasnella sp. UAMH 9824]